MQNRYAVVKICSRLYRKNSLPTLFVRASETYKGNNKVIGIVEMKKNYKKYQSGDNLVLLKISDNMTLEQLFDDFKIAIHKDYDLIIDEAYILFKDYSIFNNLNDLIEMDNYKLIPFEKYRDEYYSYLKTRNFEVMKSMKERISNM